MEQNKTPHFVTSRPQVIKPTSQTDGTCSESMIGIREVDQDAPLLDNVVRGSDFAFSINFLCTTLAFLFNYSQTE